MDASDARAGGPEGRPARRLAAAIATAPLLACALALALWEGPAARAAAPATGASATARPAPLSAAPATAVAASAAPATATGTGTAVAPATAPATGPARLMPDALPPGASLAPAPTAPRWTPGVGTPEPPRLAGHGPSTIIIPSQTIPLVMNHKFHLPFATCTDCHTKAPTSKWSTDVLIPTEAECAACHDIDRSELKRDSTPPGRCDFCHLGFDADAEAKTGAVPTVIRVALPSPHLKFPHERHVSRGIPCERCHAGLKETKFADRDRLPRMALCLECHNGRTAPDACRTCHFTEKDGKLKVEWPEGKLTPADSIRGMAHVPGWEFTHSEIATTDGAMCMSCHREEECAICHDGMVRPASIHVGDYVLKHAVEARRGDPDCQSCHRLQTFCLTCHTRMGVSMASAAWSARTACDRAGRTDCFHPPGWNDISAAGSPAHHSVAARKNLTSCIGCHREKDCARCHADVDLFCLDPSAPPGDPRRMAFCMEGATPGFSVPPHPDGFSKVCKRFMKKNVTACLRCHTPDYLTTNCGD
jgi:hypothetical protein